MRIRILVSLTGTRGSFAPGDEVEWEDVDAGRLIAAGYATPLRRVAETATVSAPEKATRTYTRRRK